MTASGLFFIAWLALVVATRLAAIFPQQTCRSGKSPPYLTQLPLSARCMASGALDRVAQMADRKYCRPHARPFRLGFPRKVPVFPICPPAAL
jgi:hypothetical protein